MALTAPAPIKPAYGSGRSPEWLGVDWSEHLRWVTVGGRRVNVLDAGEGEPIVFVHGHNVCWQHWLEQLVAFMPTHRVIALDLPGFGRSEAPPLGEVTVPAYADCVEQVCEQLDVGAATVVGNSMGGGIAAELAVSHPERVQRLVLACATGVSDWYMGLPAALIRHRLGAAVSRGLFATGAPPEPVVRALAARPRGRAAALGIYNGRPAAQPQLIHPAMVMALISSACKPAAAPAAVALASHDLRERAHLISCPTLIVWGDRDNLVPLRCAHAYARLVPDSRLLVYEDTGHNPMIERPARFNADLSAFLDEDR